MTEEQLKENYPASYDVEESHALVLTIQYFREPISELECIL